jgi:hypothetical protein
MKRGTQAVCKSAAQMKKTKKKEDIEGKERCHH